MVSGDQHLPHHFCSDLAVSIYTITLLQSELEHLEQKKLQLLNSTDLQNTNLTLLNVFDEILTKRTGLFINTQNY